MWRPSGLICGSAAIARSKRSAPVKRRLGASRALPTAEPDMAAGGSAGAAVSEGGAAGGCSSCANVICEVRARRLVPNNASLRMKYFPFLRPGWSVSFGDAGQPPDAEREMAGGWGLPVAAVDVVAKGDAALGRDRGDIGEVDGHLDRQRHRLFGRLRLGGDRAVH